MWRHVWRVGLLTLVVLGVGLWWLAQPSRAEYATEQLSGPKPVIAAPETRVIPSIVIPEIVGWAAGEAPTPAPGLAVQPFADGLDHPRNLLVLPNGDVLVAESASPPSSDGGGLRDWVQGLLMSRATNAGPSANRVTLLRDTDGDGRADVRRPLIAAGLNSPFGMDWAAGTLFVANTGSVVAYPFQPGTDAVGPAEKVVDLPATPPNYHWTRDLVASGDGRTLWVTVGSNSNIGEDGAAAEANRAVVLQVERDAGRVRVWTAGMRNPTNIAADPRTGELWATVNERDELGPDVPPDYLAKAEFGAHYGWPGYYWGGFPDRRVEGRDLRLQQYVRRPDYALGAHTAPVGLAFSTNADLGPGYARGAFVGRHGSWNRSPPAGYDVVFVRFNEFGYPQGKPVPVLGGFLDSDGDARGRPAGVAVDGRGGLLVADDAGNRVWRVTRAR